MKDGFYTITESGSNANGKYMKFGNGILIQYNSTTITNAAWQTITFPIAFVTDILTVLTTINTNSAESNIVAMAKQSNKTLTTFRGVLVTPDGYGTGNIEWLAIGKWK